MIELEALLPARSRVSFLTEVKHNMNFTSGPADISLATVQPGCDVETCRLSGVELQRGSCSQPDLLLVGVSLSSVMVASL